MYTQEDIDELTVDQTEKLWEFGEHYERSNIPGCYK